MFDADLAVKRTKLADEVVAQLLRMIRERRLVPGDRLPPERQLAQTFQVSRASLRDAIRQLELLGYVDVRQGDGSVVRMPDANTLSQPFLGLLSGRPHAASDLVEFRRILEPQVAALAARRCTSAHATQLEHALDAQRRRVEAGERLGSEDLEFHQLIATIGGNATVLAVTDTLRSLLHELRTKHLTGDQPRLGLQQHVAIADAIRGRDDAAAAAAMHAHLDAVEASLLLEGAPPSDAAPNPAPTDRPRSQGGPA
ncbi:MAG: FadR/GntR family transcriptional regulator [Trueperaceae bacterium]|nr:FadR/GntR family transcriptional regulator [Trueperaceae bacterium]